MYKSGMCFIVLVFMICSCTPKPFDENSWHQEMNALGLSGLYAPHNMDGKFFNPWMPMKEKNLFSLIQWKISEKREYTSIEKNHLPKVIPDAVDRILRFKDKDFLMWLGHGSFLIMLKGEPWLLDPILSERALILQRDTPPAISINELKRISSQFNVIISHNHYDHFDKKTIAGLPDGSRIITPLGFKAYINGFSDQKTVVEMDWWGSYTSKSGTRITCLPAQHWSKRITMGTNKSLWASYMIESSGIVIYFGGDSGYFIGYKEFGKKFNSIDYALMPTTAYHPRWFMHYQHMNIEEAITAFHELKAKYFIPTQWGTFHLGDEPPGYPALDLKRNIVERKLDPNQFLIMDIGEIIELVDGKQMVTHVLE